MVRVETTNKCWLGGSKEGREWKDAGGGSAWKRENDIAREEGGESAARRRDG